MIFQFSTLVDGILETSSMSIIMLLLWGTMILPVTRKIGFQVPMLKKNSVNADDKDFHKECGSELIHKSGSRLHLINENESKCGIIDKESPNRDFSGGKVDLGVRKELQLCDLHEEELHEEEHEVFNLRIIHKKNRFNLHLSMLLFFKFHLLRLEMTFYLPF